VRVGRRGDTDFVRRLLVALFLTVSFPVNAQNAGAAKTAESPIVNTMAQPQFEPPYPFDADELWEKLAQVTAVHGQLLTPKLVGSVFGTKLKEIHQAEIGPRHVRFGVRAHVDWYYDIDLVTYDLQPQLRRAYFIFSWGQRPGTAYEPDSGPNGNICIHADVIGETLKEQGWRLTAPAVRMRGVTIARDRYEFDDTVVAADFAWTNGCLIALSVDSHSSQQDAAPVR